MKIILLNPIKRGQNFNVNVDAVIARHTGSRSKGGDFSPLGLTYIAALLRENGFDVRVLDPYPERIGFDKTIEICKEYDMVAMPLATLNASGAFELFENLKDKNRVFLGTYASSVADFLLAKGRCDIVAIGEPEESMLELCKSGGNPESIKGLFYYDGKNVVKNRARPLIENLDLLPVPARDLIRNELYSEVIFGKPTALLLGARGCPFPCTFCATRLMYGKSVRERSVENITKELRDIIENHHLEHIFFIDDTFTITEKRVVELCDAIIASGLKFKWVCNGRVDRVTPVMLRAMKRAGCIEIRYGVESASKEVLKKIKKNISLDQVDYAIKETKKTGIAPSCFFMIGNPGETVEDIRNTVSYAIKLKPYYAVFNISIPMPGSELFDSGTETALKGLDEKYDTVNSSGASGALSGEVLNKELLRSYLRYYLNPNYLGQLFSQLIQSPSDVVPVFRMLLRGAKEILF